MVKISRRLMIWTAAGILSFVAGCGCDKSAPVEKEAPVADTPVQSELKSPAFKAQMKERVAVQNAVAARKAEIEARMAAIRKRAAKPEADPEWSALVAALAACEAEMKEELKRSRAMARAAMLKDAAKRGAVQAAQAAPAQK